MCPHLCSQKCLLSQPQHCHLLSAFCLVGDYCHASEAQLPGPLPGTAEGSKKCLRAEVSRDVEDGKERDWTGVEEQSELLTQELYDLLRGKFKKQESKNSLLILCYLIVPLSEMLWLNPFCI